MKKPKATKLVAYCSNGQIDYIAYVNINIFTYTILAQVYYTDVKKGVCTFNTKYTSDVLEIITTDPYYNECRHCNKFLDCLCGDTSNCERGLIGGVFNC